MNNGMGLFRSFLLTQRLSRPFSTTTSLFKSGFLLSDEYQCTNAWNRRLQSPVLQKIQMDTFFFEIEKKFQSDKIITAIDVDLFVNKATEEENIDELEELVHKLRKSPATRDATASTSHATVRYFLSLEKMDDLMRILSDRQNYGIFTDYFLSNLLMDKFLKAENYRDAAKIASLHMLDEDFDCPTTKFYAIYSALKYLENPTPEPWDPHEPEVDPREASKEETKIWVKWLRQPGYDFHFDLTAPMHIIGKTLAYASLHLKNPEDDVLRRSMEVLGWALFEKWERVENILKIAADKKYPISAEVITKVTELAKASLELIEASPTKELPRAKLKRVPGMNLDQESVDKLFEYLNLPDYASIVPNVQAVLAGGKIPTVKLSLLTKIEEYLKEGVAKHEQSEIQNQIKVYEKWEQERAEALQLQIRQFHNEETLRKIEEKKQDLKAREEVIFFFDNEEEWMMRQPPKVRIYKQRFRGRYKPPQITEDDTYVPPTVK